MVDGGIRIVVLDSDRRGARIGIEAPASTRIQREELVSDVASQNRKAGAKVNRESWAKALPLRQDPDAE